MRTYLPRRAEIWVLGLLHGSGWRPINSTVAMPEIWHLDTQTLRISYLLKLRVVRSNWVVQLRFGRRNRIGKFWGVEMLCATKIGCEQVKGEPTCNTSSQCFLGNRFRSGHFAQIFWYEQLCLQSVNENMLPTFRRDSDDGSLREGESGEERRGRATRLMGEKKLSGKNTISNVLKHQNSWWGNMNAFSQRLI